MEYNPDRWCVVKITTYKPNKHGIQEVADSHYRVFASWAGGYLDSDHWKLNSGITSVTQEGEDYLFSGSSGSVYRCRKTGYGYTGYGIGVLTSLMENSRKENVIIEELKEDTNWLEMKYD